MTFCCGFKTFRMRQRFCILSSAYARQFVLKPVWSLWTAAFRWRTSPFLVCSFESEGRSRNCGRIGLIQRVDQHCLQLRYPLDLYDEQPPHFRQIVGTAPKSYLAPRYQMNLIGHIADSKELPNTRRKPCQHYIQWYRTKNKETFNSSSNLFKAGIIVFCKEIQNKIFV